MATVVSQASHLRSFTVSGQFAHDRTVVGSCKGGVSDTLALLSPDIHLTVYTTVVVVVKQAQVLSLVESRMIAFHSFGIQSV